MKRFWLYLWLALLLAQVLTLWLSRRERSGNHPAGDILDAELVSLAAMTNEQWQGLLPPSGNPRPEPASTAEEELLRREELILRIREREELLAGMGVEVRLVEELKAWFAGGAGTNPGWSSGPRNRFLSDLAAWLDPFVRGGPDCGLERLSLLPDGDSPFPAITFELAGEPPALGRRLLSLEQAGEAWSLQEIDLLRFPGDNSWWMRGSFIFTEKGGQ
jgi:hypothetical protein